MPTVPGQRNKSVTQPLHGGLSGGSGAGSGDRGAAGCTQWPGREEAQRLTPSCREFLSGCAGCDVRLPGPSADHSQPGLRSTGLCLRPSPGRHSSRGRSHSCATKPGSPHPTHVCCSNLPHSSAEGCGAPLLPAKLHSSATPEAREELSGFVCLPITTDLLTSSPHIALLHPSVRKCRETAYFHGISWVACTTQQSSGVSADADRAPTPELQPALTPSEEGWAVAGGHNPHTA
ncbi:uncharacterized protein LOC132537075 [Erinaceus europaeus]|uniref:Uncharacterized protein LOC132537075 n=1 Tax=Erinaceus europaeus TaxID=9365 RepID=A0ABM3X115_ERIEU|nr:uncharacterized protein LOC132537075 [Erinaceus europaeus]